MQDIVSWRTPFHVSQQRRDAGSYLWVAMPLVHGRVGAEEVVILLAIGVPHEHSLAPTEDNRDRRIVVGTKLILALDQLRLGIRICV